MAQRREQRVREGGARIGPAVGEELAVQDAAGRVHPVQRPLERHLLVRSHAGVERDRRERGLEVEVVRRRPAAPQRCGESRLEVEPAREPRGADARLRGAEPEVVGDVRDALDAGVAQAGQALAVQAGQSADDPVRRLGGGAVSQNSQP